MYTGKKILNQVPKVPIKNKETSDSIIITDTGERINISIDKEHLKTLKPFEINRMLLLALSPLFLSGVGAIKTAEQPGQHIKYQTFKNIVFFIEQMSHYTGGRYSIFHQALLLSFYTKVTVVSNIRPPFFNDFVDYYNSNFTFIEDTTYLAGRTNRELKYDLVIGCPVQGGIMAAEWARRENLPLYLIMFESPNWVSKFRDGADADELFWKSYKDSLYRADKIMVPSNESKKHLKEWLGERAGAGIDVIYPCINEVVANRVKEKQKIERKKGDKIRVVFTGRMIPAKSPINIIKKLDKSKYHVDIIGKIWTGTADIIDDLIEKGHSIEFHGKINDFDKFLIINQADILIFPTHFEGFGMPPMESLFFGKPVVAYDLPVLREIYGEISDVHFVNIGDEKAFVAKIDEVSKKLGKTQEITINSMKSCSEQLMEVCEIPKVSVGMMVYNGADYIKYSVRAIYGIVHEIIIVDGSIKKYNDGAETSASTDGTLDIIKELMLMDTIGKIKFVPAGKEPWSSEIVKRNQIAERVTGDYYLLADHDEIWKKETLIDAINFMEKNKNIGVLRMPFYHFWLSFENIAVDDGGKWSTKHPRIWRWKGSYRHVKSFNYFQDINNDYRKIGEPFVEEAIYEKDRVYHFGYCRTSDRLLQKIEYYRTRGIENCGIDTVSTWKELTDTTQPTQKGVKSWAERFTGSLPEVLDDHPFYSKKDVRQIKGI